MDKNSLNYKELSDEVLFNRYSGGDIKAFDTIVTRHKGLIYSLILRYVKSSAIADEIFQDVFLKVCKYKDQFREAISFKSWLVTICRNTCIDYVRHVKRTLNTESLDGDGTEENRPLSERVTSGDMLPLDHITIQSEDKELNELLDKLPLEQRETFYMKVVMDLTFEEIAASKKCSVNTAKSRYRYALEALRALVNRKRFLAKTAT